MELLYYAGVEFKQGDEEYNYHPTFSAKVAFETARNARDDFKSTFYAISEGKKVAIPFKELLHLDMNTPNLENELQKIAQERLEKAN